MTDDNSIPELVDIPETLEDFKAVFYDKPAPEAKEDTDVNAVATDEDKDAPEGDEDEANEDISEESPDESDDPDAEDEESEEDGEDEEEDKDKAKRPKSRYQTRISELTRARREAERREALLIQRLEAVEASTRKDTPPETSIKKSLPQGAPDPNALYDNGDPVYPMGQFDPQFLIDLTNFGIEVKVKELETERTQKDVQAKLAAEQAAVVNQWQTRVAAYEEVNPEVRDHIDDLVETFQSVQPQYGEYLATTIMQCENGPAIMDYLSQNIGEAQKIVASGPAAATLAIGRLDDRLAKADVRPDKEEKRNKKISGSAPPPAQSVRGSSRGSNSVRPDTTDLAAFKREFLK